MIPAIGRLIRTSKCWQELLLDQTRKHQPEAICIADPAKARELLAGQTLVVVILFIDYTTNGAETLHNVDGSLSSKFLVSRDPEAGKRIKRDNMVEREMRAIVKNRKIINDKI